jgi:hypothetical protein
VSSRPEMVFLLANHNPRSRKLLNIIEAIEEPKSFDLRFFSAAFAGYGMHEGCMMRLDKFRERPDSPNLLVDSCKQHAHWPIAESRTWLPTLWIGKWFVLTMTVYPASRTKSLSVVY